MTAHSFEPSEGRGPYPTNFENNAYQGNYQYREPVHANAPVAMPMPSSQYSYPSNAPYPASTSAPFTTNSSSVPYPASAPYFDPNLSQPNPPSYLHVINVVPGKQPAYNPNW